MWFLMLSFCMSMIAACSGDKKEEIKSEGVKKGRVPPNPGK
jgi:hypothetical protein